MALHLGNVSRKCSVYNMKMTALYGYVYDFLVDYDDRFSVDYYNVDDNFDIHKYLMKKYDII